MPIVISRNGPVEPKDVNVLTPDQKAALWEHIVLAYCKQNPDRLQAVANGETEVPACSC